MHKANDVMASRKKLKLRSMILNMEGCYPDLESDDNVDPSLASGSSLVPLATLHDGHRGDVDCHDSKAERDIHEYVRVALRRRRYHADTVDSSSVAAQGGAAAAAPPPQHTCTRDASLLTPHQFETSQGCALNSASGCVHHTSNPRLRPMHDVLPSHHKYASTQRSM